MAFYPDISHWKPVANWSQVKQNCGFLISKATQGTGFMDSSLDSFIKGCEANGIPYWLYTFLDKGNEKAQAQYMVKVCAPKVGKYFRGYVLDVERGNTASGVKAALDYLKSLGGKCILYTMYAQYSTYKGVIDGRGANCAWWEARYGQNTGAYNPAFPPHAGVDLHQYTSKGICPGIGNTVDLNRITGTKAVGWFTGGGSSPVKPAPAPTPAPKPAPAPAKKSNDTIANEVIAGKWGNNPQRAQKLKAAGYDPNAIQALVNQKLGAKSKPAAKPSAPAKKSIDTIAREVIAGKWGNGNTRKQKLTAAGYNYSEVQKRVNQLLK